MDQDTRIVLLAHKKILEDVITRLGQLEAILSRTSSIDANDRALLRHRLERTACETTQAVSLIDGELSRSTDSSDDGPLFAPQKSSGPALPQ